MQQIFEKLWDVMPHELVAQAVQRRAVYHKIELEPGAKHGWVGLADGP